MGDQCYICLVSGQILLYRAYYHLCSLYLPRKTYAGIRNVLEFCGKANSSNQNITDEDNNCLKYLSIFFY